MKKYLFFIRNSLSEELIYRAHFFMLVISQLIFIFVLFFLWEAIYSQGGKISNYSFHELIGYYVMSSFITLIIQGVDVAWRVGDEIRLGNITNFILKPVSHFWSTFWIVAGKAIFNLAIVSVIFIPVFIFGKNFIPSDLGFFKISFFIISMIISFVIFLLFFYLVGLATFWLGDVRGFNFFNRTVMFFLAGNIIPLDLLPKVLFEANNFLPFKFITWFPVALWSGRIDLSIVSFFPAFVWILIMGFSIKIIYKKGMEKYEGFGA